MPAKSFQEALFGAGIPSTILMTDDIATDYARLKEGGVAFRGEPVNIGTVTATMFEDTCGNLIQLVQPNAR